MQFDFYEDLKAKKIADHIFIPTFFLVVLYDLYRNIKKGEKKWKAYSLDFLKGMALCAVLYFFILRSLFSSGILLVNSIFGAKEQVQMRGVITHKTDSKGSGKFIGEYELIVEDKGIEYIFDSNHLAIKDYTVGDAFEVEMNMGILNLIYK